jgi:hypothetical protein
VRFSWVHPATAEQVRALLRRGRGSWEEVVGALAEVLRGDPPEGVTAAAWPRLAEHVARAARVLEVLDQAGREEAWRRFGGSPHAVERAALLAAEAEGSLGADVGALAGLLGCAVDEWVAYGPFLSRLIELGTGEPAAAVAVFERFVAAAAALATDLASWPERVRVARDGLAALYVRVGRAEDAEALYGARFVEEPADTAIAIGAARAFLEAGDRTRAVRWLERGAARAEEVGRGELGTRLRAKASALRARTN